MVVSRPTASRALPIVAAGLAAAYLAAATLVPAGLSAVTVGAVLGSCALALVHRRSRGLVAALVVVAFWLALGVATAWLVRQEPRAGLLCIVGALFLLPLPLIPWLYAVTFPPADVPRPTPTEPGTGGS